MRERRRRIENFFAKIEEYRSIAMQRERTDGGKGAFKNLEAGAIAA